MGWIDGHLDLAYLAVEGRDLTAEEPPPDGCITLPALRDAGVRVVLGTIYTAPGDEGAYGYRDVCDVEGAARAGAAQLDVYERWERDGAISIIRTRGDLDATTRPPAVVLLMEGADPIRDADEVSRWHDRGLRFVGLTWARGTRYAGGNGGGGSLTPAGRDLVAALDEVGIVHDASHLSDESFDDLLGLATGTIVASHSNARALAGNDERHLRDEQIRAIGARGGVVGLNLYAGFLASGRPATIDDCVAHVQHVAATMGHRRGVALGSDMDGGFGASRLPEGLRRPSQLESLAAALRADGWSDEDVDGFRAGNWRRLLGEVLPRRLP